MSEQERAVPYPETTEEMFAAEFVNLSDIEVGERFRVDYKDIDGLCESIIKNGLIHYPVLDQFNKLIAGGRRLKALEKLGWTRIPVTRKHNCNELKLRELELEENLQRESMSWQEEVNLKNEILKLKQEIHGAKKLGRNQEGVSQADVAKLLGDSPSNFSLDVNLANAMTAIPELKECKTKDDARKKLKQLQEKMIVDELMKRKQSSAALQGSKFKQADESFIVCDAIEALKKHPEYPYSFINCDPPYGIDLNKTKKGNEDTQVVERDYREWDSNEYLELCKIVATETYRISKDTFMCFWFGVQWYQPLKDILEEVGWSVDPVPGIWYATGPGQTMQPDLMLAKNYEVFFVCRKGKPVIGKKGRSNVFEFPKLSKDKKIHPTEKPLELMVELFDTFSVQSGEVLSPFLGSGVDIRAGLHTSRVCRGFDLNEEVKKRFLLKVEEEFK